MSDTPTGHPPHEPLGAWMDTPTGDMAEVILQPSGIMGDQMCQRCGTRFQVDHYCENGHMKPISNQSKPTGESANVHIEHYFPKGYNPDAEPWKSIREHYNAALAASVHYWQGVATQEWHKGFAAGTEQLAAERTRHAEQTGEMLAAHSKLLEQRDDLAAENHKLRFRAEHASDQGSEDEDHHPHGLPRKP